MDAPIADDTDVRNRKPSAIPDLADDFGEKTGMPLSGFDKPNTEVLHSLHICLRVRRDGDSSPLAGLYR